MTTDPASHTHDDNQDFIRQLVSPERDRREDTITILAFSDINDRDTVADIGCGPGFYTIPLAKAVSNGKVYALDVDDEMLDACRRRLAEARLGNVEVLKCQEYEFPLEDGSLNGLFLGYVVHHVEDRVRFLEAARRLMRPRGWCTVLEWDRQESEHGPPLERRIDPGELRRLTTEAGFRHLVTRDLGGAQYMTTLRNG